MVDPFTPIHVALDFPKHPTWGLESSLPRHGNIQRREGKRGGGYKYIDIIGWEIISLGRKNKMNLMDCGDGNGVIMQSLFRSHEDLVDKWECFKVISTIHDSKVVSIIYEVKVVSK